MRKTEGGFRTYREDRDRYDFPLKGEGHENAADSKICEGLG